jgi:CMP-N-acetylneuraminic acid synthetase|tara:strand:- start:38 stop:577 length:540 start_codon:yes stop_codon:yes gene_type:complete
MRILTIIPTKLDSTRLKEKNIQMISGKPMFHHSIEYAQNTIHQNKIIVSSESDKVNELLPNDVFFHRRDLDLCGDVEVVDVYLNVIKSIDEEFDYVVCLQPDNPDRTNTFDDCLDYMVNNNYDDLITVNDDYKRSGSVRVFKYEHLKNKFVSKRMGVIKDSATDIHYKNDLDKVKEKYD